MDEMWRFDSFEVIIYTYKLPVLGDIVKRH